MCLPFLSQIGTSRFLDQGLDSRDLVHRWGLHWWQLLMQRNRFYRLVSLIGSWPGLVGSFLKSGWILVPVYKSGQNSQCLRDAVDICKSEHLSYGPQNVFYVCCSNRLGYHQEMPKFCSSSWFILKVLAYRTSVAGAPPSSADSRKQL